MADKIALYLEAEKRGILPENKKAILAEMRNRGMVPNLAGDLATGTGSQTAGPEIDPVKVPGAIRSALPTKEQLPELLLGGAAGVAAQRLGGPLAAGAVGTAAAGGEAIKQIGQRAGVFEGEPPQTSMEAGKKLGGAFLRGAGAELGGRAVMKGVQKAFSPFSGSFTPEIAKQVETAKSAGIEVPLGQMTNSKFLQANERATEFGPFFGNLVGDIRQKAIESFKSFSESVGDKIAAAKDPTLVGNMVKESTKAFKESFNATKDKLYDAVMPQIKDADVNIQPIVDKLEEIISRRSGAAEPPGLGILKGWLDEIRPQSYQTKTGSARFKIGATEGVSESFDPIMQKSYSVPDEVPGIVGSSIKSGSLEAPSGIPGMASSPVESILGKFPDLKKFRTNVGVRGKFDDQAATGVKADINELYGVVTNVMDDAAKNVSPQIYSALKESDAFYQQGLQTLKSKLHDSIVKTAPENIHKTLITPNAPSTVELGREIIGDEAMMDVARIWFDSILDKSTIKQGGNMLNPVALAKNLEKYGSTVDALFKDTPELLADMNKLSDIGTLMSRGRDITAGSQTAFNRTAIAELIAPVLAWAYSPKAAAAAAAAIGLQGAGAKFITSGFGRKYLTSGFPAAGRAVGRVAGRATQGVADIGLQKINE